MQGIQTTTLGHLQHAQAGFDIISITHTSVTHHALTMSKMDRLYGVTMAEKGISQLVAVDLQKAESMVA